MSRASVLETDRPRRPRLVRRAALLILVLVAVVGAVSAWRLTTLTGLPVIPDPFDVARYARIEIPESENAFTFYRRAYDKIKGINQPQSMPGIWTDWSMVTPRQLEYLEAVRPALDLWLEGTRRDRAVYVQPIDLKMETMLPVTQMLREMVRPATLLAFKLQREGDHAQAWTWLRGGLRSGRHSGMHGILIEGLVGSAIFDVTTRQVKVWADDPKVDASLLRRALGDVLALEALDRSPSQMVRTTYYSGMDMLRDIARCEQMIAQNNPKDRKSWSGRASIQARQAIAVLRHQPERDRRVLRLIVANWLTACDLPFAERSKRVVTFGNLTLYKAAAGETPAIEPAELARWYETAFYAREYFGVPWNYIENKAFLRDATNRADLIVYLADALFQREHGRKPATVDELVGPYLKEIPSGYVAIEGTSVK